MLKSGPRYKRIVGALRSSPVVHRLARGAFWSLLGTFCARVLALVATIVIAKLLGVADYGAYAIIQSTLETFGLVAGFSLGGTTTKYLAEYRDKDKPKASRILSLTNGFALVSSGIVAALVFAFSGTIANDLLHRADLAPLLSLGAIYLFVSAQNTVQIGSLGGFEAFKETAKINVVQGIAAPVLAVPLVYFLHLQGAMIALIIVALIGYVLCRIELGRKCAASGIQLRRFDLSAVRESHVILHFAIPSFAAALLVIPVTWLANTLLVNQPNGYAEMGLFSAANQWRQLVIYLPNVLAIVLLPVFSDFYANRSQGEFRSVFDLNLGLAWMIALPATIAVIAMRGVLASAFGSKYAGMDLLIIPLAITAFFNILNNVVGTAIAGAGRMWVGALLNACWATAMAACTWLLVPALGATGLALSYMTSYLLHTAWTMAYAERKMLPGAITRHWRLISLTCITIIPAYLLAILNVTSVIADVFILAVALTPLVYVASRWYRKHNDARP